MAEIVTIEGNKLLLVPQKQKLLAIF